MTDFDHPGWNFYIQHIYGRDIDRFYYGGHFPELLDVKINNSHIHNYLSNIILENRFIGVIKNNF